jgi:hypothetical protein
MHWREFFCDSFGVELNLKNIKNKKEELVICIYPLPNFDNCSCFSIVSKNQIAI